MFPPRLPPTVPCPVTRPIPGAVVVFVVPRHLSAECAPRVGGPIHARTLGGIPLLRLALPPATPLEVGVIVYARMVGPLEGRNPMKRTRASKDVGIEGRIVAARPGEESGEVEFVVKNESWGLAPYASILVRVGSHFPVTVSRAQQVRLGAGGTGPPGDRAAAHKPVRESAKFVPGTGPHDTDYMYLVPETGAAQTQPFRESIGRGRAVDDGRAIREVTSALGFGWVDSL